MSLFKKLSSSRKSKGKKGRGNRNTAVKEALLRGGAYKHDLSFFNEIQFKEATAYGNVKRSVDIVALHGISGDAYSTWTRGNGSFWLRDFLPFQSPGARILPHGYPAWIAFTRSTGTLNGFARALVKNMSRVRSTAEVEELDE